MSRTKGLSLRFKWWALTNWLKGYRWGAIQRFRCCDHTTPFHSVDCIRWKGYGVKDRHPRRKLSPSERNRVAS